MYIHYIYTHTHPCHGLDFLLRFVKQAFRVRDFLWLWLMLWLSLLLHSMWWPSRWRRHSLVLATSLAWGSFHLHWRRILSLGWGSFHLHWLGILGLAWGSFHLHWHWILAWLAWNSFHLHWCRILDWLAWRSWCRILAGLWLGNGRMQLVGAWSRHHGLAWCW